MRSIWIPLILLSAAVARAQDISIPAPPQVAAESYYLMDAASGKALASGSAHARLPPASLTKLMTAYVVFTALADGRIALAEEVRVSERAWRMTGSRMFIEVDTEVRVEDLVRGMIIQSGNDASVALAEHIAGSVEAFIGLMNEHAAALGMHDTAYRNPTGLPARDHYSSAYDSAILARALIAEFPDFYGWYREREFTYNGIRQHNRNTLLWRDESVDGLKTGHTNAAGYCLVSSAERAGMRLIAAVMGAKTPNVRAQASQALLDYGFDVYETHRLYARGEPLVAARVFKGTPQTVALGLSEDLYVTIPRGRYADLAAITELEIELVAPLAEAARVGEVRLSFQGAPLAVLPLVSLHRVPEGGWFTRMADGLELWLDHP